MSRLAVLFAVALIVRLAAIAAMPHYAPRHDDRDYDRLAWAMASGDGYPPVRIHGREYAVAYRPPLWPAVLGAGYAIAGHHVLAGRIETALLGALGVLALAWVASELLGPRAAWWAGAIGAVYLPLVLMASVLESETLFVLVELLALGFALRGWAIAAGAMVGLAALARVDGLVLLAGVLPLLGLRRSPYVLVACALAIAPWTIRNAIELHAFVPVSTESGATLAGTYNAASMDDGFAPGSWVLLRHTPDLRVIERHIAPVPQDRALREAALDFVERHPWYPAEVLTFNLQRWLDLASFRRARFEAQTADIGSGAAMVALPFAWALAAAALIGWRAVRRRPAFWLAPGALLAVTLLVNAETPRFRAPLDPFLIVLAAYSVSSRGRLATRPSPEERPRRRRISQGRK